MRVTPSMMNSNAIWQTQLRNAEVLVRQTQLSTGFRLHKPSDDPFAWSEIAGIQRQINELGSEEANLNSAQSRLNTSVSTLQDVTQVLVRAKQIAIEANQATDEAERNGLATEVDHLIQRLLNNANAQESGEYFYTGTAGSSIPFELRDAPNSQGGLQHVVYNGSDHPTETIVSASIRVQTSRVGSEVFLNRGRGETVFLGDTGATSGTGTDSGIGRSRLLVRHIGTSFAAGSGIATGVSSSTKDTLIGQAGVHQLEIHDLSGDGSSGTISLNGGEIVTFTNTDSDLRISGPKGETIYVDTSNISAGFNGTIDVTGNGEISVDGGASFEAIDFSANQSLTHSETGTVTNVNTSTIVKTGKEHLEYTQSADVFTTLLELRDDIRNERGLISDQLADAFGRRLGDIDRGINHITSEIGRQAADLEDMKLLNDRNGDVQLQLKSNLSEKSSVDYAEAVTSMQESLDLLKFTYSASSQILQQSILNYL